MIMTKYAAVRKAETVQTEFGGTTWRPARAVAIDATGKETRVIAYFTDRGTADADCKLFCDAYNNARAIETEGGHANESRDN